MSKPIRELNLELGRPDAAEALRRLRREVEAAVIWEPPAMKLIHGYGSSGRGWAAAYRLPHLAAAAGAVLLARGGIHYIQ